MRMHKPDQHSKKQDYIHQVRKPHERRGYGDAGPNTQGGDYHGGPKRWTGRGPVPARHIPWPELFKHHLSVVEGHLKMMDMVRKHTVEGSGNYKMICEFLERCKTMIADTRRASRTFVPPANQRDQVPLGSSSASMYPGYSPADHIYGEAAQEFGAVAAQAKKRGEDVKLPNGVDYQIGQNKSTKRKHSIESAEGSTSDAALAQSNNASVTAGALHKQAQSSSAEGQDEKPLFVVDTQPMKVDLPEHMQRTGRNNKKAKTNHEGNGPLGHETEDISAEVDAKVKEKREKKKHRKEEKKRKRESDDEEEEDSKKKSKSASTEEETKQAKRKEPEGGEGGDQVSPGANGKRKKSKKLKSEDDEASIENPSKRRTVAGTEGDEEGGEKKKKKRKKADGGSE